MFLSPSNVLPHRDPFLFLDEIIECEDKTVIGRRTFTESDSFFKGHFPNNPLVPGVVLIEALSQTLAYWALRQHPNHWVLLTGIDRAKIMVPVRPNDTIEFKVQILKAKMGLVIAQGSCHRLQDQAEVARA
jgi:3-hydroxyacyl-[acyl-carrier-protein] dehydratase